MNTNAVENRRLLLVDDTPAIHEDYRKILAGAEDLSELDALTASVFGEDDSRPVENFDLTSAMQGQEALQLVKDNQSAETPFAAAFVDMRMPPGWDGLQTIEKIWQVDPKVQVVICTAYSDYSWDEIISRIGGDGKLLILKKPFDSIEVRQLANTLCRKWELERAAESENRELAELSDRLRELNSGLEQSVAERTASLQLVLDSTGEGIFTVDLDGRILSERSRIVELWLGEIDDHARMWNYLAGNEPAETDLFKLSFDQMVLEVLPFEVAAAQAPQRIERDGKTFDLYYREVRDRGNLERILVLVHDVSAQVEAERAAQTVLELQTILGNLFEDSGAFLKSVRELERILSDIKDTKDLVVARRLIHTLKGNAAVLGFRLFAQKVHCLEDVLEVSGGFPDPKQIFELEKFLDQELRKVMPFSDLFDNDVVKIQRSELDRLIELLGQRAAHAELLSIAESWKLQSMRIPLKRLASQAERLASQLDKKLETQIVDHGLCMPEESFSELWPAMVHLIRNAVDHGLESPAERRALKKPEQGLLCLETEVANGWLEIRVRDDGRGIDWDRVRDKAKRRGLPVETTAELTEAMFADGVSTREVASELSGRGVGLATVRQAVERYGGGLTVTSAFGQGTTFAIRFPWEKSGLAIPNNTEARQDTRLAN